MKTVTEVLHLRKLEGIRATYENLQPGLIRAVVLDLGEYPGPNFPKYMIVGVRDTDGSVRDKETGIMSDI